MKIKGYALFLALITLSGCASTPRPEPLFDWGAIPGSYDKLVREPGDASLAEHIKALQDTINQSAQKGKRVPPGVYCELGYLLFKGGQKGDALHYYDLEISTYPESRLFVEHLKAKVSANPDKP